MVCTNIRCIENNKWRDMSMSIWWTIGVIAVIVWSLLIWEAWNAPVMSDDYDLTDEEREIRDQLKQHVKEKNKKGFYNGKDDKWYPDHEI